MTKHLSNEPSLSDYESYDKTSENYDSTRCAVGVEILLGCFASTGQPLDQLTVLDAGCGTGNYAFELAPFVRRVEGIVVSQGMLAIAREKARALEMPDSRLLFQQASLTDLPFADESFDTAMVNQVLHHLRDVSAGELPRHKKALCELARVMRPGGILTINLCTHAQLQHGFWFRELFDQAFSRLSEYYLSLPMLKQLLIESGFHTPRAFVPVDALFQGDSYFDGTGPLRGEWRNGDSVFSLATEKELGIASRRIEGMFRSNELTGYVATCDAKRQEVGQVTFLSAVRATEI